MNTIHMTCDTCNQVRYKSTVSYGPKDKPKPSDFVNCATGEVVEEFPANAPPSCNECGTLLRPQLVEADVTETPRTAARPRLTVLPGGKTHVDTLFEVGEGEAIANVNAIDGGFLVLTNRRIVKVNV